MQYVLYIFYLQYLFTQYMYSKPCTEQKQFAFQLHVAARSGTSGNHQTSDGQSGMAQPPWQALHVVLYNGLKWSN